MKNWEDEPITDLDLELAAKLDKATPVKARVSKDLKMVYSVRLSRREVEEFTAAAQARNMNLSEFLRAAAQTVAQGDVDLSNAQAVGELKEKARELNEAIERLTA